MEHFKKSYSGDIGKVLLALSLGVNIVTGFYIFYQYKNQSIVGTKKKTTAEKMAVHTHKVTKGEIGQQKTFSGNVRAIHAADLAFVHQGILDYIGFKPGTFVKKGTLLLGLKNGEQQASYQEAIANEKHARFTFEKINELYKKGYQPKAIMEEKRAAYETAKAKVMAAESALKNTKLYAPFDGVVGILDNDAVIGRPIDVNKVLARVIKNDHDLEVDFSPSETDVKHLSKGQTIMVGTDDQNGGSGVPGVIEAIDSYSDNTTHTVKVRALIKGSAPFLRDGASVTVSAHVGKRKDTLVIPRDCIEIDERDGSFNVYQIIAQNGELFAAPKSVTPGLSDLYSYEIEEGLEPGAILVADVSRFRGATTPISILPDDPMAKELKLKKEQSAQEKDHYSKALKDVENKK